MVSVQLLGGLGNQLFQMAACIGYAKSNGFDYCIPNHTLNDLNWTRYKFKKINYCDESVIGCFVYREQSHTYSKIPVIIPNSLLCGYFQSPLYFKNYRNDILRLFGFDNLIIKSGICSIHVRRGDYLLYPTKHPVVTAKYLIQAIEQIEKRTGNKKYLVFSDDMEWCKSFFKNISAYSGEEKIGDIEFEFSENKDELTDLKLMAECEHNIISNSTFSWWGAWLNNNPDKVVVTPHEDNWFGIDNKHLDVSTLLPENWIRIKY